MRDMKCIQNFVRKIKRVNEFLEGISIDEIILKFIIKIGSYSIFEVS
jgi:hypothetical protein